MSTLGSPHVWLGDLSIVFDPDFPQPGGLHVLKPPPTARDSGLRIFERPPAPGWKGYPITHSCLNGWRVWLLGELFGSLTAPAQRDAALAELIAGKRPAEDLSGHFLVIAREEAHGRWHVWTDPFGTLHAYYAASGNRAAIGTCFSAVSRFASRRELDWPAMTAFFGLGFFPNDRTFYSDVAVLRPATHYVFGDRGQKLRAVRFRPWKHEPSFVRNYDDTVAEFGSLWEEVLRNHCASGRIALPISGGLDSRCTVAALGDRKRSKAASGYDGRIWSYSYGYCDDSIETHIAQKVAQTAGLPFQSFTVNPYLFDCLQTILAAVEGFQELTQCRQAAVLDPLGQNADYVIAAHWGDVWCSDMGWSKDNGEDLVDFTLGKMSKRGANWLLQNVCAPRLKKEKPEELLREFVKDGLSQVNHIEDLDFRVKAFKTEQWSFRWTLASLRMFQAAAWPRLPFYDTRLADFFSTVPTTHLVNRKLQIDYLKRFAPDLARIKWQARDADLFSLEESRLLTLSRRALIKAGRVLSRKHVVQRNWEVQFGGRSGRDKLENWFGQRTLKLYEFIAPGTTRALIDRFYREWPEPSLGYAVSALFTFAAFLECVSVNAEAPLAARRTVNDADPYHISAATP